MINTPFDRYWDKIPLTSEQEQDCKNKILALIKQGKNHYLEIENFCDDYTVIETLDCLRQLVKDNIIREERPYYRINDGKDPL